MSDNHIHGDFILLRADTLRLLFPLEDVTSITHAGGALVDVGTNQRLKGSQLFGFDNNEEESDQHNKVALSDMLDILPVIPHERFIVVSMNGLDIRLCWSEMTVFTNASFTTEAIPSQFLATGAPLSTMIMLNDAPAFVCNAQQFLSYVFSQQSPSLRA